MCFYANNHEFRLFLENMKNWKNEMHGIKGKLTELSTIMYACISIFASIGFMASLLLIPNCSAFPTSHVYEAYVNNHVGRFTLFVTFGFELFLMSIFVWKCVGCYRTSKFIH